jgi:hypothetical protein
MARMVNLKKCTSFWSAFFIICQVIKNKFFKKIKVIFLKKNGEKRSRKAKNQKRLVGKQRQLREKEGISALKRYKKGKFLQF